MFGLKAGAFAARATATRLAALEFTLTFDFHPFVELLMFSRSSLIGICLLVSLSGCGDETSPGSRAVTDEAHAATSDGGASRTHDGPKPVANQPTTDGEETDGEETDGEETDEATPVETDDSSLAETDDSSPVEDDGTVAPSTTDETDDDSPSSGTGGLYAEGLEPFSIDGLSEIPPVAPALEGAALEDVLTQFAAACEQKCTESLALGCALDTQTHERCVESCVFIVQNSDGFCVQEQLDRQRCQVESGYACTNDRATPVDSCTLTTPALYECQAEQSCRNYCVAAIDLGCTRFTDLSECVAACARERDSYPERCHLDYEQVVSCVATVPGDAVCDGQRLFRIDNYCNRQAMRLGGCLFSETNNICESYCQASDHGGCGVGCRERCAEALTDADCGGAYLDALDCMLFFDDGMCVDGVMDGIDTICEDDWNAYLACTARAQL